ncbi:BppU family phage baseplate upper protein [Limosilactobacillus vaginalis]|uniref:BppU family phage baseplate upper protein n=1 Tax=Limosilactobacillus vaginalis TaxID=1633 RepID=UPI00242FB8AA|nr:BppU family phage baseplate upper protein [Limosilactobacillus vaginalis]
MAQELTFNISEDQRKLQGPVEAKNFNLKFGTDGVAITHGNPKQWVQGRIGDKELKQVFVNITEGENNTPKDVAGLFLAFVGIIHDKDGRPHRVVDYKHSTTIDVEHGRFRFDFPDQAFTVAGEYQQAFFMLVKEGPGGGCVATMEFDMQVMANFVFTDLVPEDYITPFNDTVDQLLAACKKFKEDTAADEAKFKQELDDAYAKFQNDTNTQFSNFKDATDDDLAKFKKANADDIANFKQQYADAVKAKQDELQNIVNNYTDKIDTMLKDLNQQGINTSTMLTDLRSQMAALQDKINSEHLFTEDEAKKFEDSINARMDHFEAVVDGFKAKWHDVEVIDFNPTRDGKAHTLSESYSSVDEAQKDYPVATSLADTKDWCAITEAIQEGQKQGKNVYVAPGHYVVNKTITLPTDVKFYGAYQNSRIFASQQMCEDSKKNPIAILEYDDEGQPPLYIENIHVLGNSDTSNQIVGLHVGGNRASRIVNLIVSNAYGHGTWIHATNENSGDVENMTFEHYWQVQSGSFRIESNANIDRGNITDFAVNDSQITSLDIHDDKQTNQSMPAVEIINDDSSSVVKTIYGISFARCFLHAQANNLVRIVGNHALRATHSINFDFIKGELHDEHGGFSSLCDKYFLFHLESCWHVMIDHSTQLLYSGASYIEMKNAAFCDIKTAGILYLSWLHSDSKIFTMDELCYENHINLVGEDLFLSPGGTAFEKNPNLGYDYGNAVDAMDLFDKMVDKGADNHISGYQIAQTLTLNNEPHRLKDIDKSGKITGLMEAWQKGVTSSVEDNTVYSKHVFAKGVVNEMLMLPLLYKRTSGFLISIRAIGNETDLKKMKVLVGSNFYDMPTDQEFHRWTGICPTSSLNAIGIQVLGENVTLDNDVTVEIEYLDAFMENKIPYYPAFVALPAPTVGEANY